MGTITLENLCVLNDWDRPCVYLLATKKPLQYASLPMRKLTPDVHTFSERIIDLKEFGFIQEGDVFRKVKESTATYADGRPRDWDGRNEFTIEDLLMAEKP